jgi:hypothetical protein
MDVAEFWHVTPYCLVDDYRFGGTFFPDFRIEETMKNRRY